MSETLTVVVPAYREFENLRPLVAALHAALDGIVGAGLGAVWNYAVSSHLVWGWLSHRNSAR